MNNDYLLLTPGPLSTSHTVKEAMLKDWCTWDDEYNQGVVQVIRKQLCEIAVADPQYRSDYSATLMQGSGTASVEAAIGTFIPKSGTLLVINNGAYGARIIEIANYLNINVIALNFVETELPQLEQISQALEQHPEITHVAMVHCETTTGMLNPAKRVAELAKHHNKVMILDAMSSFGGIEMDMHEWQIDILISSANKCIQGVPGFGFVIAKTALLVASEGQARSLSLDLHAQWKTMENHHGKWRFTSPTHVVRAFAKALEELAQEGGASARFKRYSENQKQLVSGMKALGFEALLPEAMHSPIITSFYSPNDESYEFKRFYEALKQKGYVIYPGKVSNADCFRIGNIGEVYTADISGLLKAITQAKYW